MSIFKDMLLSIFSYKLRLIQATLDDPLVPVVRSGIKDLTKEVWSKRIMTRTVGTGRVGIGVRIEERLRQTQYLVEFTSTENLGKPVLKNRLRRFYNCFKTFSVDTSVEHMIQSHFSRLLRHSLSRYF